MLDFLGGAGDKGEHLGYRGRDFPSYGTVVCFLTCRAKIIRNV